MGRKEIYAALEIADHEVRLVIGELFEARLNMLRVERVQTSGVNNRKSSMKKQLFLQFAKQLPMRRSRLDAGLNVSFWRFLRLR